jgi:hypothetical protein
MNISAGEFSALNEKERAVLVFEALTNVEKGLSNLNESLAVIKKCVEDGRLADTNSSNAVENAQKAGDEGIRLGKSAHRRVDNLIWAGAILAVTTLASLVMGIITLLVERGIKP